MNKLNEMEAFVAVVEAGSFVRGADALQISKTVASRLINDLEARLGVRLLQRTTRRLSLTEEGGVFLERCRDLLSGVAEAEAEVAARAGEAIGQVRVNVPVSFGLSHLAPLWPRFMARHPKVALDVTQSDRLVDLVDEGYDLAVRIAKLPSTTLISRRLSSSRLILCASPKYLRRRGKPAHPEALADHAVMTYTLLSTGEHWDFVGPDGPVSVKVTPRLRSNSGDTCIAAALEGQGIVLQPSFLVEPHLETGALVELMPQYRAIEFGIYAVYPSRKHLTPKVRVLIDFLAEALADTGQHRRR
jgi:DNA-binding transcriptional LysR family regulator